MEGEKDLSGRPGESSLGDRGSRLHFGWYACYRTILQVIACIAICLPLAGAAFGASSAGGPNQIRGESAARVVKGLRITAVEGDSWLRHLGIPFIASNMGRVANWGPSPSGAPGQPSSGEGADGDFVVSGADLYRLNCQSCHKADGSGAPPEINSLIGPVQATSPVMIRAQMKQRGVDLDAKTVSMLVSQADTALHTRLQNGGEKMPPFRHLAPEEVAALLAYLEELAGIPGAERKQIRLSEPAGRVGELLVKGTCHVCHEASGPGLAVGVAMKESIPSLASLPIERFPYEVIRKVREGISRPTPMMTSNRGEMPVFSDLRPEEVAAAYAYLVRYPPKR
jgi:mono/diheme cytochrome c family protein